MYKSIKFSDSHLAEMPDPFDYSDLSENKFEMGMGNFEKFILYNKAPRYLYVVRCASSNFYKIGITNDLDKRLQTHQTGCPFELTLVLFSEPELEDMYAREIVYLEKFLHSNFKKFHVRGEWYELSYNHISDIIFFLENDRGLEVITSEDDSLSVYEAKVDEIVRLEGRMP
ncbi:GIY-YIG nuclease family protein [Shewanella sp. DW31]|uniref:GIY-YIG nuclease family protein n=1 Tax=Shewanella sp. DW31 TaxID=2699422 RepID=UPI0018E38125|nr:GIY-YIG nuclease family protein [Shewanella sp. DW31]MBI1676088.1 GIY-YIG nuclease family protein [Shewanella sp. DW31]